MRFNKSLNVIDSHTMGEPTRVIVGGIPKIIGKTMAEKKEYLTDRLDYIRTSAMHEPRGHSDMFGSIITNPSNEEADFGIIFMDGGGYLNMCGHGSIGAATIAVETGMVEVQEPVTQVKMDTPAGLITAEVFVEDGKAKEVSIVNVPAFLYKKDVKVNLPEVGEVTLDISFGGSFFAIVHAKELNLEVNPSSIDKIKKLGMSLLEEVNKQVEVKHPILGHINSVDLVEIYDKATHPEADFKNVVVFGKGQVDRSPCGTGTSAKIATLYAKNQLDMNEEFVYESILGTLFKGEVIEKEMIGTIEAIRPKITGSAFITGFNNLVIDPEDPVKHGFLL